MTHSDVGDDFDYHDGQSRMTVSLQRDGSIDGPEEKSGLGEPSGPQELSFFNRPKIPSAHEKSSVDDRLVLPSRTASASHAEPLVHPSTYSR